MIKKVIEYIHRPNKTEIGTETNTNDSYLKLSPALEFSEIFKMNIEEDFLNVGSGETVLFKAVKYQTGGKEYRLTKLGAVRSKFDIECGDELVFRREIDVNNRKPTIEIHKFNKVMIYSVSKGKYTIVNPERIDSWNAKVGASFNVLYKGKPHSLTITFLEDRKKREDSPDVTSIYTVSLDSNPLLSSTYCISLNTETPTFQEYNKWELYEIILD